MHKENTNNLFNDMLKFLTIFFKYKWMIVTISIDDQCGRCVDGQDRYANSL